MASIGLTAATGLIATTFGLSAVSAGASSKPIVIGAIAGTTGAYGSTGVAVINGTEMAVAKINASGGVLGRQLQAGVGQRRRQRHHFGP